MKKKVLFFISFALLATLLSSCYELDHVQDLTVVQGTLDYYPSYVKSKQAWYGHEFMVDQTPEIPTTMVTKEELMKLVGKIVEIRGVWNPGERWQANEEINQTSNPIEADQTEIFRNDGVELFSVELMDAWNN